MLPLALLIGPATPPEAVATGAPRNTTSTLLVGPSALIPATDDTDYSNAGSWLMTDGSQWAYFVAPLDFPVPEATVRRITLFAQDNSAAARVCTHLYRALPRRAADVEQAMVCSENSAASPQVVSTTQIAPRKIETGRHAPYLLVGVSGATARFYGVLVTYRY
ncbi:MAG: hypothetical protein JW785_07005 [Acidimicrobiia bacterium]|nr:hypothetical protein [Acidimicrobiia bacterium]